MTSSSFDRGPGFPAAPPPLWGCKDHVRAPFGGVATGFQFKRHVNRIEWEKVETSRT